VLAAREQWEIGEVEILTTDQAFTLPSPLRIVCAAAGSCGAMPLVGLDEGDALLTAQAIQLSPREGWVASCALRPRQP
jgi:hypothetical protein